MTIIISQPVAITASQQTTILTADHFGDQIVGLNKACIGRFESQSIKEPETICISGTNMVKVAYQINWSKPDITGTSFSLRLTLSTILATILQV